MAYRPVLFGEQYRLEAWPESLALGSELPVMPLWLDADLCLPLHLDETYVAACDALRIRL